MVYVYVFISMHVFILLRGFCETDDLKVERTTED